MTKNDDEDDKSCPKKKTVVSGVISYVRKPSDPCAPPVCPPKSDPEPKVECPPPPACTPKVECPPPVCPPKSDSEPKAECPPKKKEEEKPIGGGRVICPRINAENESDKDKFGGRVDCPTINKDNADKCEETVEDPCENTSFNLCDCTDRSKSDDQSEEGPKSVKASKGAKGESSSKKHKLCSTVDDDDDIIPMTGKTPPDRSYSTMSDDGEYKGPPLKPSGDPPKSDKVEPRPKNMNIEACKKLSAKDKLIDKIKREKLDKCKEKLSQDAKARMTAGPPAPYKREEEEPIDFEEKMKICEKLKVCGSKDKETDKVKDKEVEKEAEAAFEEKMKICEKLRICDKGDAKKDAEKGAAVKKKGLLSNYLPDPSKYFGDFAKRLEAKLRELRNFKLEKPDPKKMAEDLRKKLQSIDWKMYMKKIDYKDPIGSVSGIMSSGGPSRPMKFPYTYSAKIAQFPLKFYMQKQWIWRYYAISVVTCVPLFYYIHKLSNSPGNVAKWAEIRRKEAEEHHH